MSKFDTAKEDLQMAVDAEPSNKEYLEALQKCLAELKWNECFLEWPKIAWDDMYVQNKDYVKVCYFEAL